MQIIRLVYFLVFDLLCVFSKLNSGLQEKQKSDNITKILENQKAIEKLLEGEAPFNFKAIKKAHLKEWNKKKQELLMKTNQAVHAITLGKDPEQFAKDQVAQVAVIQERGKKMRNACFGVIIVFIAYKKLVK